MSGLQELNIWSLDVIATYREIDESAAESVQSYFSPKFKDSSSDGDIEAARKLVTRLRIPWLRQFGTRLSTYGVSRLESWSLAGLSLWQCMNRVSAGSSPLTADLALLVLDTIVANELLAGADALHAAGLELPLVFGMPASAALAAQHRLATAAAFIYLPKRTVTLCGSVGYLVSAECP
ncbi:hypothetical protein HK405_011451, partial [Cladochytrium tenue]